LIIQPPVHLPLLNVLLVVYNCLQSERSPWNPLMALISSIVIEQSKTWSVCCLVSASFIQQSLEQLPLVLCYVLCIYLQFTLQCYQ
jgi:hypothetical protein